MSTKRVYVVDGNLVNYDGLRLEKGQIFELRNKLQDNRLMGQNAIGHRYVQELDSSDEVWPCTACGREFVGGVTGTYARAHLQKWRHDLEGSPSDKAPALKTGHKPRHEGGRGNPDSGDRWDLEPNGPADAGLPELKEDPYQGDRVGSKELPKRLTLA